MIALRSLAPTTAVDTASASMACALARMDGVELTAPVAALVTDNAAAEMASALRVNATATLDGLAMLAIFAPVCMIAPNTDIATTVPASAKRDTVAATALCLLSPSLANVPSTACVAACSSAPRYMRLRVLAHRMSAIPSVLRSAFLNAWLERCL